jgi:hypothetical protein
MEGQNVSKNCLSDWKPHEWITVESGLEQKMIDEIEFYCIG